MIVTAVLAIVIALAGLAAHFLPDRSSSESAVSTASLATRMFGWFAAWLVVATAWSLFLIPDSSDPNNRDAENWVLLPLTLAMVAGAAGLATAFAGFICLVRRERLDLRTVTPLIAGTGTTCLPVLWVASALLRH
jgi:hypothetical protein